MVGVVEGLCLEDQLMVLMARDDVEALLERGIEALEAGAVDDVAGAATGKGADGGGLKDTGLKPLGGAGGTELVLQRIQRVRRVSIRLCRSSASLARRLLDV